MTHAIYGPKRLRNGPFHKSFASRTAHVGLLSGEESILDWPSFSIKWPMEDVRMELYHFLKSTPLHLLRRMKAAVHEETVKTSQRRCHI